MPNYLDVNGKRYFLSDEDIANGHGAALPVGCVEISEEEALLLASEEEAARMAALPKVLASVSPRQIRQALTHANLRTAVESSIAAGDQDGKDWWEFATQFERLHPKVVAMGQALGQTEAQLDDLWHLAASL